MKIVSVGTLGDDLIVSIAIPKAPLRIAYAIPKGQDIVVNDLTEQDVENIVKESVK